jgi:hypothetical protein
MTVRRNISSASEIAPNSGLPTPPSINTKFSCEVVITNTVSANLQMKLWTISNNTEAKRRSLRRVDDYENSSFSPVQSIVCVDRRVWIDNRSDIAK